MTKQEIEKLIQDTATAIKVLCFLYPRAGGYSEPRSAAIVLRRLQLRQRDLMGFLETKTDE